MLSKNQGLKMRDETTCIEIYRTKTKPNDDMTRHDIHKMALEQGQLGIGYHYVIQLDGTVEIGRPIDKIGLGDLTAVCICVVGGLNEDGQLELPFFTDAQQKALEILKIELISLYPIQRTVTIQ
jgi:N-acetylmuramoyl-L-alanine amidase|tara:strand:- start:4395 stop:4766 length:372 start_codon:yes stop_codon:yes gene_type:complete